MQFMNDTLHITLLRTSRFIKSRPTYVRGNLDTDTLQSLFLSDCGIPQFTIFPKLEQIGTAHSLIMHLKVPVITLFMIIVAPFYLFYISSYYLVFSLYRYSIVLAILYQCQYCNCIYVLCIIYILYLIQPYGYSKSINFTYIAVVLPMFLLSYFSTSVFACILCDFTYFYF